MSKKCALYFSGTGNTAFAIHTFMKVYDDSAAVHSIEETINFEKHISEAEEIILGYPIYLSLMPEIMHNFLKKYRHAFQNKTVSVLCTEELFSGDGTALAFRQLRDQNITIHQAIHILMPNNITDVSFLLAKSTLQQATKLKKKKAQITRIASRVLKGKKYKHGRRFYSRFLGYALQRSFGRRVVLKLKKKVRIHPDDCVLCGQCVKQCPVDNLSIKDNKVITHDNCTLCYRCVNICPTKAISLLSKTPPKKQYYINKKT